jgi:serine/alanine adding enzyme
LIRPLSPNSSPLVSVTVHHAPRLETRLPTLTSFALANRPSPLSQHPAWLSVLREGLGHEVYAIEATASGVTCGYLPLAFVSSVIFGRYLVSLPYLNSNGVISASPEVQTLLVDRAVELADELGARNLELRHEQPVEHPALNGKLTSKVHMRMPLPGTTEQLWKGYDPKVRNQVRKGEKHGLTVTWGRDGLLEAFYAVLSQNMRDLGTPVYSRAFFRTILATFPGAAELCVVRAGEQHVAGALLLHGNGVTEVPTASSLKEFNSTCANMLMYRHLIDRAVERGQSVFDFGRSTEGSPTHKFKKQWGAVPSSATWQYYVREGAVGEMRPENPRYQRMIRVWQRLPVRVTQVLGPRIVRGIP